MLRKREREQSLSFDKTVKNKKKKTELDDFATYNISECIQEKLKAKGITTLFEVQKSVFTQIHSGKNVVVASLTGSGKTLSFVIPTLQRIKDNQEFNHKTPIVIVLTPTRELAIQVGREFSDLESDDFKFSVGLIYGGVSMDEQTAKLRRGCDVIVGTPGRVIDMCERGLLSFKTIKNIILDEADRMLDMGFLEHIEDIFKRVYEGKKEIQVCLFSATIPTWVKEVAVKLMNNHPHEFIDLVKNLQNKTPKTVQHLSVQCLKSERVTTIADLILCYGGKNKSTIVFVPTKAECNSLMISDKIKQEVQIIHGDINQKQREATIEGFKKGKFKCLVATDVASRGLDIPSIDLIIQSEPPKDVDTYIHRAGRTARAGRTGMCITLYTKMQESYLNRIAKTAQINFKKVGAPQTNDIIDSNIRDVQVSLAKIDDSVKTLFLSSAKKIIDLYGAEDSIARLLALASGHTEKLKSRSLLCGSEGYVTYMIKTTKEVNNLGYIWGIIKKLISEKIHSGIRGMKFMKTRNGGVFDILEEHSNEFEEILYNDRFYGQNYSLERPTVLPELIEPDYNSYANRTNSYNTRSNDATNGYTNGSTNTNGNANQDRRPRSTNKKFDIFVGNLPFKVEEDEVKVFFNQQKVGNGFDVRIPLDKETGKPKGYGFVTAHDQTTFDAILKLDGQRLKDRSLRITAANKN